MKHFLFPAVAAVILIVLGGCALMSDEDRDFYGRGWVNPKELDQPFPHHAGTPKDADAATATTSDPSHDSAWDVPGAPPRP